MWPLNSRLLLHYLISGCFSSNILCEGTLKLLWKLTNEARVGEQTVSVALPQAAGYGASFRLTAADKVGQSRPIKIHMTDANFLLLLLDARPTVACEIVPDFTARKMYRTPACIDFSAILSNWLSVRAAFSSQLIFWVLCFQFALSITTDFFFVSNGTSKKLRAPSHARARSSAAIPADVVGLAGVLKWQAVWLVFVLVGADGDDGLSPALRTGRLIPRRTRAEQHPVAVFCWNLRSEKKEKNCFS